MSEAWVRALAPAKVNLTLELLGKRDDGYWELVTWMLALDLADELRARATQDGAVRLALSGPFASADVPADATNLAARAARAALDEARARGLAAPEAGIELALVKRIPSRAGLGGGSSDAAAAWIAAEAALSVELGDEVARVRLRALGSDCNFFREARAGLARCSGRGERVEPADVPPRPWWIGLAVPGVGASTREVYARALPGARARSTFRADLEEGLEHARAALRNDLEGAALAAVPELVAWRACLDRAGLDRWRLSGSGSAWFGLHASRAECESALESLRAELARSGLAARLVSTSRPAGHGARLAPES